MTIDELITELKTHLPPLYPQEEWKPELSQEIETSVQDEAVRAGLLLWNDDLHASHTVSQGLENPTGSFWHAIMHRREGDASNSHYWWQRTGQHPAFPQVNANVLQVLEEESDEAAREFAGVLREAGTWQPMEFVGRCELARRGQMSEDWLQRVQVAEMEALLDWCRAS